MARTTKYPPSSQEMSEVQSITVTGADAPVTWTKKDPNVGRWYPDNKPKQPSFYLSSGQLATQFFWNLDENQRYTY